MSGKSTVARLIASRSPWIRVVEVDDIKYRRYGTPELCVPEIDFREAGEIAKEYLVQGYDTIIVEPFCVREHFDLVMDQVGRAVQSFDVSVICLSCCLQTSVARHTGITSEEMIKHQHSHYGSRYRPECEQVIHTDLLIPEQVAAAVLEVVPLQIVDLVSGSGSRNKSRAV